MNPGTAIACDFDRVVVINLARRPDRLTQFRNRLPGDWPFSIPQRVEAIDGASLSPPPAWKLGRGAWACLQSHRSVLDAAIADGVSSLLVLEDDAVAVDDLATRAPIFLASVPPDWNCLMLGGEHLLPPRPVAPGVVRCVTTIRCHAYALRGPLMSMLSVFWACNEVDHCDLVLASLMGRYPTYAPDPPLFGQAAGESDVTPGRRPLRFFGRTA